MSKFLVIDEQMNTLEVSGKDENLCALVREHYTEAVTHESRRQLNLAIDAFLSKVELMTLNE